MRWRADKKSTELEQAETIKKQAEEIKLLKVCSEHSVRFYSLFSSLQSQLSTYSHTGSMLGVAVMEYHGQ